MVNEGAGYTPAEVVRMWQEAWDVRGTNRRSSEELRAAENP